MGNLTAPHAAYRKGDVLAATPGQLVVLLHDGARRFLRKASLAMRDGEVERAHNSLRRAERIVGYLDGTLDYEQGELPRRLHAIYQFCLDYLNAARLEQDHAKVEAVAELLGEMREAWSEVAAEAEHG
jgi:flagellar secretion chaperone FliS